MSYCPDVREASGGPYSDPHMVPRGVTAFQMVADLSVVEIHLRSTKKNENPLGIFNNNHNDIVIGYWLNRFLTPLNCLT